MTTITFIVINHIIDILFLLQNLIEVQVKNESLQV